MINKHSLLLLFNSIINVFAAPSMEITILNKCPWNMDIYKHNPYTRKFDHACVQINPMKTCIISIDEKYHYSGLIKNILGEQATLFEFTKTDNGIWYDLSVIPPGSGVCYSWEECNKISKKKGFNDALNVIVNQSLVPVGKWNSRCKNLYCRGEKCPDAYLWPFDDNKTHFCEVGTKFKLEYC
jgi:hypothetical protein